MNKKIYLRYYTACGLFALLCCLIPLAGCTTTEYDDWNNLGTPNTPAEPTKPAEEIIAEHTAVDLGLSVRWATCNVGASSPEDYGDYYAWGETTTKSSYTESNSVTYNKTIGDDISGNSKYDVARAKWGNNWRMPTREEWGELVEKCTWTWTSVNNIKGYRVTASNGNSIFFSFAGFSFGSTEWRTGEYWSSTSGSNSKMADLQLMDSINIYNLQCDRYYGLSVRPVID